MARGGNNGGKRRRVTGGRELSSAREIEVPLDSPSTNESHNEVPLTNDAGGSDLSQQTPTLSAHRPYIFPYKNKFTDPKVGKVIISDFKSMFSGPWPRWTDVPKGHRKLVFESFQRTYQWDSSLDVIVEENWEHIIKKRYSDIMSTVRDDAVKMARKAGVNVRDLTDVKPFYPEWIDEKNFAKMIDDVWNTSEWKHVSKSGKDNRGTLIEGQMSRHSGGSLSFDHHQLRMKGKGGPVPEVDVYKETHTKTLKASEKAAGAPTQYTTLWYGMVLKKYLELATERFGSERDTHPKRIDRELWEQASGGMKKGTLFGISNDKRALTTSWAAGLSGPNMGGTSNEVQSVKQQLEEHEKKAEEFRKEAEELRKEAEEWGTQMTRLQEQEREMSGQLAKLTKILNEKFPPSA